MNIKEKTTSTPSWLLDDKYTITFNYNHGYELEIKDETTGEYFTYHSPEKVRAYFKDATAKEKRFGKTSFIALPQ